VQCAGTGARRARGRSLTGAEFVYMLKNVRVETRGRGARARGLFLVIRQTGTRTRTLGAKLGRGQGRQRSENGSWAGLTRGECKCVGHGGDDDDGGGDIVVVVALGLSAEAAGLGRRTGRVVAIIYKERGMGRQTGEMHNNYDLPLSSRYGYRALPCLHLTLAQDGWPVPRFPAPLFFLGPNHS
jgi:hypothetical protein